MEIEATLVRLREATAEINRATDDSMIKATLEKTWILQDRLVFPNQVCPRRVKYHRRTLTGSRASTRLRRTRFDHSDTFSSAEPSTYAGRPKKALTASIWSRYCIGTGCVLHWQAVQTRYTRYRLVSTSRQPRSRILTTAEVSLML